MKKALNMALFSPSMVINKFMARKTVDNKIVDNKIAVIVALC